MPSQITDVFYANFIQWAHEKGNCFSTIKLYCNQLKEIGEEFNDTVITEVKVGGVVNRSEKMLRSQICQDIRTVHFL